MQIIVVVMGGVNLVSLHPSKGRTVRVSTGLEMSLKIIKTSIFIRAFKFN